MNTSLRLLKIGINLHLLIYKLKIRLRSIVILVGIQFSLENGEALKINVYNTQEVGKVKSALRE